MRLSKRKLKHKHKWELVHSKLFTRSYACSSLFRKPQQLDVECVARLFQCSECEKEKAEIWSDYLKDENHMEVYMADAWGEVDPMYYHLKFLESGK